MKSGCEADRPGWRAQTQIIVAFVFSVGLVYLAVAKAVDLRGFADIVRAHGVTERYHLSELTVAVSWAVLVGLAGASGLWAVLACRAQIPRALLFQAALFMLATIYAAHLWQTPPAAPVPCGCGLGSRPIDNWLPVAVRNAALCVFACVTAKISPA